MTRRRLRPSPAFVVACLALFVALGGPAQARKLISGRLIKPGTVTAKQVKDRSLRVADLGRNAVAKLQRTPAGAIGEAALLDGAVTAPKLGPSAVTTAALAFGAVTGPNIQDATIGLADMGENSIGGGKIRNGAVHKEDIAQQAVGTQELAGTQGAGVVPAGTVAPNACTPGVAVAVAPAPAAEDAVGVLDDVVIGGRTRDWPAGLALRVQPTAPGTVTAYACNTGSVPVAITADLPFTTLTIAA